MLAWYILPLLVMWAVTLLPDKMRSGINHAAAAAAPEADLVELRLDPLPVPDYAAALDLVRRAVAKPLIVTVRTAGEGGPRRPGPRRLRRGADRAAGPGRRGRAGH